MKNQQTYLIFEALNLHDIIASSSFWLDKSISEGAFFLFHAFHLIVSRRSFIGVRDFCFNTNLKGEQPTEQKYYGKRKRPDSR